MSNLLKETKEAIRASGHKIKDVAYIGNDEGYSCTWKQFIKMADVEYDSGFGAAEVATDLSIVFTDGSTMWRHEYDGSENWDYSIPFVIPENRKTIKRLVGAYWPSLKSLQDDSDTHHNPSIRL